ncbi:MULTISPECIES: hypothetical protein [unclassified Sphingomonas]|uniref:hypothetical protein n=1 Tax=unclassified Sphingomonas TaxID=196159 RepID=UPI001F589140|nr:MULTISPECIES: hypothetical protein [unclassified Sphingomonas]
MRWTTIAVLAGAMLIAGCGPTKKEKRAMADARAANFVPPSVTSRADFGRQMERRFHELDHNGDDVLTPDEYPRRDSKLAGLDRNHDGRITQGEFSEGMMARFDKADLNHDSAVTSDERAVLANER